MPELEQPTPIDEAAARRVLLLQAFETAPEGPLWTAEDRGWATRAAQQALPPGADAARFVSERAALAMQRLAPRDAHARRLLAQPAGRTATVVLLTTLLAVLLGAAVDHVGPAQQVDLLAPPVWALVLWNLVVYVLLAVQALRSSAGARSAPGPLRRWLRQRLIGTAQSARSAPWAAFGLLWARHAGALTAARAALLLHAAAAGLALGVIGGLYLRGLVFDYRTHWGSTFLDAVQVQTWLSWLLAPASALTGLPVPEVAQGASAAPWIHLHSVTLALLVLLPRTLLAAFAGAQAWQRARAIRLPLAEPYFQRLLPQRGGAPGVAVRPYAATPDANTALALRTLLAAALGADVRLDVAAATAAGDEEAAGPAASGCTLQIVLLDLAATPEAEAQGRFVQTLQRAAPALPLLLLADEAGFARRFGHLPARMDERREAWQRWAAALALPLVIIDLAQPASTAAAALQQALQRAQGGGA